MTGATKQEKIGYSLLTIGRERESDVHCESYAKLWVASTFFYNNKAKIVFFTLHFLIFLKIVCAYFFALRLVFPTLVILRCGDSSPRMP